LDKCVHLTLLSRCLPPNPLSFRFQVIELLATTITKDSHLQHTSTRSAGSTLGKHLRHLHDHYRLLLDAIPASNDSPSSDDTLNVNYDVRLRNGDAENHHDACVESFKYLRERMKRDTKEGKGIPSSRPVRLTAIIPEKVVVESSKQSLIDSSCLIPLTDQELVGSYSIRKGIMVRKFPRRSPLRPHSSHPRRVGPQGIRRFWSRTCNPCAST